MLGTELQEASLKPETLENNFSNEGGVGNTYQMLKNIMGLWLLQECKREWDAKGNVISFSDLVKHAEITPAFRSIVDPDDLRFMNPKDMLEEVQAFCRETKQPIPQTEGEVVRCILESLALRYRASVEQAEMLTESSFEGLHMVGGRDSKRIALLIHCECHRSSGLGRTHRSERNWKYACSIYGH